MPRDPDAPSRMEILVLSTLARRPMHGYEIKLELRYKHVRWWAKCEHGHLYSALARLEKGRFVRAVGKNGERGRRILEITPLGRKRLSDALEQLGPAPDATYFDIDLFLAGAFSLPHARVLEVLEQRAAALRAQLAEAEEVRRATSPYVPAVGRLIIDHRVAHLAREAEFADAAAQAVRAEASWGAFLGAQPIEDFLRETGVPLEADGATRAAARPRRRRK